MSRASADAASYAAKKKEQLARASAMRADRESRSKQDSSTLARRPFSTGFDTNSAESMAVGGHEVECQSYGDTTERITIRRPQSDAKQSSYEMMPTASNSSRFRDMSDSKSSYTHENDLKESVPRRTNFFMPPSDPSGQLADLSDRPILCSSFDTVKGEVIFGGADHALYSVTVPSGICNKPPRVVKMYSKRCGHTDWVTAVAHIKDGRVISSGMDGKLCLWDSSNRAVCVDLIGGHTKSISKVVSSTTSNIALSCGYDASAVLWSFSDEFYNNSSSSGSGGGTGSGTGTGHSSSMIKSSTRKTATPSSSVSAQSSILSGHSEAIVECALSGDSMAITGDRLGGLILWDLSTFSPIRNISKGHRGSITSLLSLSHCSSDDEGIEIGPELFLSAGVDGIVRLWDPRVKGPRSALEIPAHAGISNSIIPNNSGGKLITGGRGVGGGSGRGSGGSGSSSGSVGGGRGSGGSGSGPGTGGKIGIAAAAIACMATLTPKGGGDISGVVTGGADSTVCLLDARMSFQVVERWEHHRTGVYSICTVGSNCVFTGDGSGMMHCYSTLESSSSSSLESSSSSSVGLKYGLGCSQQGAVRCISKLGNKIVTGGEDGKALILSY